jgi:hypothetical protein
MNHAPTAVNEDDRACGLQHLRAGMPSPIARAWTSHELQDLPKSLNRFRAPHAARLNRSKRSGKPRPQLR